MSEPRVERKESSYELTFTRELKKRKLRSLKLNIRGQSGWPDRLVLIPGGRPLLVELKRVREDLEPLQVHRREELVALGYTVVTAAGLTGVLRTLALLDHILQRHVN